MSLPTYTSLSSLQEWFIHNGTPYWTLYAGHNPNKSKLTILGKNLEETDVEDSFNLLSNWISAQSSEGAKFTIFQAEVSAGNHGKTAYYKVAKETAIAGINGHPNNQGVMPYMNAGSIQKMVEEKVEEKVEMILLQQELESMKAALKEKENPSFLHKIGSMMMDDPEGFSRILGTCLGALIPKPMPQAYPSVHGTKVSMEHVVPQHQPQAPQENQVQGPIQNAPPAPSHPEEYHYTDRTVNALDRLRAHFPAIEEFLEGLATYTETNPEMAKAFFNQIKG